MHPIVDPGQLDLLQTRNRSRSVSDSGAWTKWVEFPGRMRVDEAIIQGVLNSINECP